MNPLPYIAWVSFDVPADAYDRFMGRYSIQLSPQLADLAEVAPGQTALDVGCGPGALTGELVQRLGASGVLAVDPSKPFVETARSRFPGVVVEQASADSLPFEDQVFDRTLAQLVVHFMPDPIAGLSEMKRVTKSGGVVAACVWDFGGDRAAVSPLWQAARQLDQNVDDESDYPGTRAGHLGDLFRAAGLRDIKETELAASVSYSTFEDWWEPFTFGVGPSGAYVSKLDPEQKDRLRDIARSQLGETLTIVATAWAARGAA